MVAAPLVLLFMGSSLQLNECGPRDGKINIKMRENRGEVHIKIAEFSCVCVCVCVVARSCGRVVCG